MKLLLFSKFKANGEESRSCHNIEKPLIDQSLTSNKKHERLKKITECFEGFDIL